MKKLILATLALSCASAFAGNVYVGANAGSATHKLAMDGGGITLSESSTAFGVNAGYQITPMFGIEAGYTAHGEASTKAGDYEVGTDPKSFYAAATATFPVTPQISVFAKAGVARSDTTLFGSYKGERESFKKNDTSGVFGIGASYAFAPNLAIVAEYTNFGKVAKNEGDSRDSLKVAQVSAGVRFSF
jgi:OOP family OmpA-OmpF porin